MNELYQIGVLAVAVGTMSLTLTKGEIFDWLRVWLEDRDDKAGWRWLSGLFGCPYCMAHWMALGAMFLYQPLILDTGNRWPDLAVSWLVLVALSSIVSGLILRVFK